MTHKMQIAYHILLSSQYVIWTINPFKGNLVLKGVLLIWILGLSGFYRVEFVESPDVARV